MFMTKRRHEEILAEVVGRWRDRVAYERQTIDSLQAALTSWRRSYEAVVNTPEAKVDTEAAFKRGVEHSRRMFKNWLLGEAERIDAAAE